MEDKRKVLVEWRDAIHLNSGWLPAEHYLDRLMNFKDRRHFSCGYVFYEDDDTIAIGLDFAEPIMGQPQGLVNMVQIIHKKMVTEIIELVEKEE
jgi:hypothetical protein